MSRSNGRLRILVAAILLATPACGGNTTVPMGGANLSPDVSLNASSGGSVEAVDMTSILKKLTKNVKIGSTVDPTNGDNGPRALSLAVSTFGLKKGQLLVCNFDDKSGTAGKGSTIDVFDPKPNSKPRTFVQSSNIEGCDGNAVTTQNVVYGTGMESGEAAQFDHSGTLKFTYGSPLEAPFGDADAYCGQPYAPEGIYVSDAKTGAMVKLSFIPVSSAKDTETQVVSGFAVNKASGWSALGPSGMQYDAIKYRTKTGIRCIDTVYVVDGVDNTIVALTNVSGLLAKDEVVIEPGGKKFVCHAPQGKYRPCATLVYSGSPLNAPVAQTLLPNGNLIVANTKGGNTLVELTPTGKVLDTKTLDTNKTADVFGILSEGTEDSNTVLFYTDTATNTLQELEQ